MFFAIGNIVKRKKIQLVTIEFLVSIRSFNKMQLFPYVSDEGILDCFVFSYITTIDVLSEV